MTALDIFMKLNVIDLWWSYSTCGQLVHMWMGRVAYDRRYTVCTQSV